MNELDERARFAENAALRYDRALAGLPASSLAAARLKNGLPTVDAELARAYRLVELGRDTQRYVPFTRSRHTDPSYKPTRRQRFSLFDRRLHNLNRSIVRLERLADAAVAVAVANAIGNQVRPSIVEGALDVLTATLAELQSSSDSR